VLTFGHKQLVLTAKLSASGHFPSVARAGGQAASLTADFFGGATKTVIFV
jgi:hypothetical protein